MLLSAATSHCSMLLLADEIAFPIFSCLLIVKANHFVHVCFPFSP